MNPHHIAGVSYIEVMVATVIVVVALIPGIEAISSGLKSTQAHVELTETQFHVTSRLEELLAQPLSSLDIEAVAVANPTVATSFSDAPGALRRRLVYLSRYDGDDADADGNRFTGGDEGLIWIRVEVENSNIAIETLTGS